MEFKYGEPVMLRAQTQAFKIKEGEQTSSQEPLKEWRK